MLLIGISNLLVGCDQGVQWFDLRGRGSGRVGLKHLVITSEIKSCLSGIATDCRIIHGLYILSFSQVKRLVFKMDDIVTLSVTEVGRSTLSVFHLSPRFKKIVKMRLGSELSLGLIYGLIAFGYKLHLVFHRVEFIKPV